MKWRSRRSCKAASDFDSIPKIIGEVLSATEVGKLESISQVLEADSEARESGSRASRAVGDAGSAGLRPVSTAMPSGVKLLFMSGFFTAVLAVGVILGFMILIHEFGHYAAAKLLGVRVEVFSIGFGKRLFGFRRGDTDYRIAAIPLGGYVKMSGENPMDERTGDPGEFMSHPRWHRFIIAIAGPAMNILFAVGLLTCVYMVRYEYPAVLDEPAVIGWVVQDTPAAKAGIQAGDRIVRIDGIRESDLGTGDSARSAEPQPAARCHPRARSTNLNQDHRARSHTVPTRWVRQDGRPRNRASLSPTWSRACRPRKLE